ncbi:hypothetical protein [Paraburkholderia sp. BL17N1]|uniref:hypothetical protein n=1 Tax=Paraburkholderia sp. BL17N1 TaxID=1938798 RepID=UPI0011C3582A|nr:hypothetical protein [Paraburkholderia sp. BL17N1]
MNFQFRADPSSPKGRPVNVGIVAKGFVDISGLEVVHGVDVSKWQDQTDFTNLRSCLESTGHRSGQGLMHAPFVYVRLTAGEDTDNELLYRAHWYNARSESLLVGPYHAFVVQDVSVPLTSVDKARAVRLEQVNLSSADKQARAFRQRLGELLLADPIQDTAHGEYGKPYLPIVLALIEKPQQKFSDDDRRAIGKFYGEAACRWIDQVRSHPSFRGQRIIVFTSASVFADYDLASAPCDLGAEGIWISQHTLDGSRYGDLSDDEDRMRVQELCKGTGEKSRCIIQQYTSYGGFALFSKDTPLDLDRFYGSEADLLSLLQHAKHPELWK